MFFVLLSTALSLLYFLKAPKTYQSTARVFVDEKNAPSLNSSDRDTYFNDTSIEQYLVTLKSTKILAPAIADGEFEEMESFDETEDILFSLREGDALQVKPADIKSNSGVIKLSFDSSSPEEGQEVLAAIVDSFGQYIKSTTKNIGGENAIIVERAQTQWLSRLKEVEKEIELLSVRPELLNVDGRITNPYQMQLMLMHQDMHNLRSERNKIIARVENIKQDQTLGRKSDDLIGDILSETSDFSDNAYARTQDQMIALKVEEQDLLNQFGGDHPQLKSVRRKISIVEQMRQQELAAMRGADRSKASNIPIDLVADFLKQMDRKVELLVAEETQLGSQIQEIQKKSTSVSALVEKLNALQRERERLEAGYYAIIERMSEMNALKEHLWRNLAVLDPPSIGEVVAPRLPLCLAAGLALGGLLGIGFAGFKDIAEKTFRSSDDVGRMLDTRVIGHVSLFQKKANRKRKDKFASVQPEIVTIHSPASQASESYRAIRTSIFFRSQEINAKVIQVTSPTPSDGKSTTVSNLAVSIAQSGRRALLIDADLRKPTQHKLFGYKNDKGLSSVIAGDANP